MQSLVKLIILSEHLCGNHLRFYLTYRTNLAMILATILGI